MSTIRYVSVSIQGAKYFFLFLVIALLKGAIAKGNYTYNRESSVDLDQPDQLRTVRQNLRDALTAKELPQATSANILQLTKTLRNQSNNLNSITLILDSSGDLFVSQLSTQLRLFPNLDYTRFLKRVDRSLKNYLQIATNLNPLPGVAYQIIIRNPALPFLRQDALYQLKDDLGTIPAFEDERLKNIKISRNSVGLGFNINY